MAPVSEDSVPDLAYSFLFPGWMIRKFMHTAFLKVIQSVVPDSQIRPSAICISLLSFFFVFLFFSPSFLFLGRVSSRLRGCFAMACIFSWHLRKCRFRTRLGHMMFLQRSASELGGPLWDGAVCKFVYKNSI